MSDAPKPDYRALLDDAGLPGTEKEIQAKFQAVADDEGLVTNTSLMSPFWRLISAIVTKPVLWLRDVLADVVLTNLFVATAIGTWLDLLAWAVRLERKAATCAQGAVTFIKTSADENVTIPAGTVIQTERVNGEVYRLIVDATTMIPAGIAQLSIACTADTAGSAWNLAPGYYHVLPVAVAGVAEVTTGDDWLTKPDADRESDDEFRPRIRNQFNVVGNYHIDAVYRSAIASVAGLSTDRIFFLHDAPRGPGTANAYLLLDAGVISDPFIAAVNDYVMGQGNHGHGDDMQCFPMPETFHELEVTLHTPDNAMITDAERADLPGVVENMVRCAFRENSAYDVTKTWPWSRFGFSKLGEEIHEAFPALSSVEFSLDDIVSELNIPRLRSLSVKWGSA